MINSFTPLIEIDDKTLCRCHYVFLFTALSIKIIKIQVCFYRIINKSKVLYPGLVSQIIF